MSQTPWTSLSFQGLRFGLSAMLVYAGIIFAFVGFFVSLYSSTSSFKKVVSTVSKLIDDKCSNLRCFRCDM